MTATNGGDEGGRGEKSKAEKIVEGECKETMEEKSKQEMEEESDDSEEEDEEPHLTWVEKYDRPMPQVAANKQTNKCKRNNKQKQ